MADSTPKQPTSDAAPPKKSLKMSSSARVFVPGAGLMAAGATPPMPVPFGMPPVMAPLEGAPLRRALQQQIEYYFSQNNLSTDTFLKSQMDADQFVPIDLICGFPNIKHMFGDKTVDRELIISVMRASPMLTISEDGKKVAPKHQHTRKTLFLRDIPEDVTAEEIENLFQLPGCPAKPTSTRKEVQGQWFATFNTEDECTNTVMFLRGQTFRQMPIQAGVKSENSQFRSYYAPTGAASAAAAAVGGLPPSMPPMDPQTVAAMMYLGYPPFYPMPPTNGNNGFHPPHGHPRGQQGEGRAPSGSGGRFSQRGGKRGGRGGGRGSSTGGGRKNATGGGGQRRTSGQNNVAGDRGQRRSTGGGRGGQQGQRRGGKQQHSQQEESKAQGSQQPSLFPSVSPSSKEEFPELPARGRPAQPAKSLAPKPKIVYSKKQMAEIVEKLRAQSAAGVKMPPFMQSKFDQQDRVPAMAIHSQPDRKVQINTPFPIMYPASPSPLLAAKHAPAQPPALSLGKTPVTAQ
eukprot:GABV01000097.1.p1 GENE.GABV01000097.1~~GABV01000097.1.p1  ORF type:complete len:515 (-),score=197.76 GABV01000097.1:253-1797(-)